MVNSVNVDFQSKDDKIKRISHPKKFVQIIIMEWPLT